MSPDNCLKIDLNQITSNAAKKSSLIIASSPNNNDDYSDMVIDAPFVLYGATGDPSSLQASEKKKGPGLQGIS